MPKTRIEPYRPPYHTIRELMEGRLAGAEDGGIPPKGYLGRPPKSAYRKEDRAEAQRRVRAREIQFWRGEDQWRANGAGGQQKGSGRETGKREGGQQRDARKGRSSGIAGDRQGASPKRAKGQDASTERKRDPNTCAVLSCVRAGKRVPQGRKHSWNGKKKHPQAQPETEQHRARRGRGNRTEQARQKRGHGWQKRKKATPGDRARRESPQQVKKEAHHPHKRGREKRPVLGARNGPRMDEDPVGRRRRVAGGPVGYKHEKMGKGDETEKDVWGGRHNSPGSMERRRARRKGCEG